MPRLVAFLRAVNVGGTGKLPMADLRALAQGLGFQSVATHLASGNLLFEADSSEDEVRAALEDALETRLGKRHPVFLRDAPALHALLEQMPFQDAPGGRVAVLFGGGPAEAIDLKAATHRKDEEIAVVAGHLVIHFPSGMGQSKLKLPEFDAGTLRNRNTIHAIAEKLST